MLFTITAILFVVCICISITTFKEVPLPLIESMDLNANDFMLVSTELFDFYRNVKSFNLDLGHVYSAFFE